MKSKIPIIAFPALMAGATFCALATEGGASSAESAPFALLTRSSTSAEDNAACFISRSWTSIEAELSSFSSLPKSYFSIVIR